MISRYEATLNGVAMSSLHNDLLILDLVYSDPSPQFRTNAVAGRDGTTISSRYKEDCFVTIQFELHIYGIAARQAALASVIAWARAGGILTTNDRPGQQLSCVCTTLPTIASARNWTDPLEITFSAASLPYWESDTETTLTLSGLNPSGNMTVPGCGEYALMDCTITPDADMTSLSISIGSRIFSFSLLSVAAGQTVAIRYDENRRISIKANGVSIMQARDPASADDLAILTGSAQRISISSNARLTATFTARGVFE